MTTRMLGSTLHHPVTMRPCDDDGLPRLHAARTVRTSKRSESRTWRREQA